MLLREQNKGIATSVSADRELLRPIYKKQKDWILTKTESRCTDSSNRRTRFDGIFSVDGISCSANSFVVNESAVLRMNICIEKPVQGYSVKLYAACILANSTGRVMSPIKVLTAISLLILIMAAHALTAQSANRITIVADAFGSAPDLEYDLGYAAFVEFNGHRILFDTGNDSAKFARNVASLGIDLLDLDAVVISHRHGDHTDGLHHLRSVNPDVPVFAPSDEYFGGATPGGFFRRPEPSLPPEQRYFAGRIPSVIPHGTPWRGLNVIRGAGGHEIAPGIRLVENLAPGREFGETPELTLVIDSPAGQVVLIGCSHPGIEKILASIEADVKPVALLAGGLHLLTAPDNEVERIATTLLDHWGVRRIAPGHCSGEYTFAVLRRVFGSEFVHAGVGTMIMLE